MKRTQIQIAIDALKKQLEKYREQREKSIDAMNEAAKMSDFFDTEMKRLEEQIKQLETK